MAEGSAGGWSEELQRDVIRVLERQARSIMRVDDAAMLDAELIQVSLPFLQFAPVPAAEGDVVQARPVGLEAGGICNSGRKDVEAQQGAADGVDDVPERAGVLVQDGFGPDQPGGAAARARVLGMCSGPWTRSAYFSPWPRPL
jgi:hypothetical protein